MHWRKVIARLPAVDQSCSKWLDLRCYSWGNPDHRNGFPLQGRFADTLWLGALWPAKPSISKTTFSLPFLGRACRLNPRMKLSKRSEICQALAFQWKPTLNCRKSTFVRLCGLSVLPSFRPELLMLTWGGIQYVPAALTQMVTVSRCSVFFAFVSC